MKKKVFLFLAILSVLFCVLAISVSADEITVDGINYKTNSDGKTANFNADAPTDGSVTALVIPETITDPKTGKTYTVTGVSRGGSWPTNDTIINSVVSVVLPATVNSVPSHLFRQYKGIKSVTFLGNIKSFDNAQFFGCTALEEVVLTNPSSFTHIGGNVFDGCSSLTTFDIPETVTSIGVSAFSGCKALEGDVVLLNLTSLGGSAFKACAALNSAKLCGTFTGVPSACFYGANSITSIDFSGCENLTYIGDNAFRDCYNATSIIVPKDGPTSVGVRAFNNCYKITEASIPNKVKTIAEYAYSGASMITAIELPDTLTQIDRFAFSSCTSLTTVKLSSNLTKMGGNVFQNAAITKIVLPASLTTTDKDIFNNTKLVTAVIANPDVSGYVSTLFSSCGSLKLVFYAGKDATVVQNQIGTLNSFANHVSYEQYLKDIATPGFTGYSAKTIVYGTQHTSCCGEITANVTPKNGSTCVATCANCAATTMLANPVHQNVFTETFAGQKFFSTVTIKDACKDCNTVVLEKEIAPIFYWAGYSAKTFGEYGFGQQYIINTEALDEYKAIMTQYGKTFSYGVVAAGASSNGNPLSIVNGAVAAKAGAEFITFDNVSYDAFFMNITGMGEGDLDVSLVCCAYVQLGDEIVYLDNNESVSTVTLKSYNQIDAIVNPKEEL